MLISPPALRNAGPRPRVDTHPPISLTFGPEAVALAAIGGLTADPWQADAIDRILAVDPDTGKWACFEYCELVSRQNGKGTILEIRALAGLLLLGEELIMWSAHEYKTAIEGFRRCLRLLRRLGTQVGNNENLIDVGGRLIKVNNTNGEEGFECLDTGQRLKFIARSKGSGRGFSGDVNIIDEAFAYTLFQQEALFFTASARPNPQFIYTSSPPLDGITGDVLYGLRHRGDPEAPRSGDDGPWRQDPELGYRDWGLAGSLDKLDGIDLDDRRLWKATNPSLGNGRLTYKSIERERRTLIGNPAGFARERYGIWPKRVNTGAGVISAELWEDLKTTAEESGRPTDYAMATVVSADRSRTAIAAVGPQSDGRLQASVVSYLPGTELAGARMEQLHETWRPVAWAVQDKGPTGSLMPELERRGFRPPKDPDKPMRGDLAVPWAADVAMAYGLFVDTVRGRRFAHLSDLPLDTAIAGAQIRPLGSATTWDFNSPVDVSCLQAVTLALWAWLTLSDRVDDDYDVADSFG